MRRSGSRHLVSTAYLAMLHLGCSTVLGFEDHTIAASMPDGSSPGVAGTEGSGGNNAGSGGSSASVGGNSGSANAGGINGSGGGGAPNTGGGGSGGATAGAAATAARARAAEAVELAVLVAPAVGRSADLHID